MDLLPGEEQQQIIDTAAGFLAREFPIQQLFDPEGAAARVGREQLRRIAELGWFGIGLPEELDGIGCGAPEEALLFAEIGRQLMPPSLLGSVLGARIAGLCGATDRLHAILEGECKVALAVASMPADTRIGESVDGEFLVYEARDAELVLVADTNGATLLPAPAPSAIRQERCIDESLDCARWEVSGAAGLYHLPAARDSLFLRGALLTSAMLLGIAEATLARSVDYARQREQFGKPIGSFQAIKHYCAEMSIRCESVRSLLHHASLTLEDSAGAGLFDACALKALAIDAAQANANTAVQIHGGMGFTQEMDIHLFVKRALVLGTLFGGERYHLRRLLSATAPT